VVSTEKFANSVDMERAVGLAEGLAAEADEERYEEHFDGELDDEDDAHVGDDPAEGERFGGDRFARFCLFLFLGRQQGFTLALFFVLKDLVDDGVEDRHEW
jgi:hypothetical protein